MPRYRSPWNCSAVFDVAKFSVNTVTEGRFTSETRGALPPPELSREQARERGIPTSGHIYSRGDRPGSVGVTVVSPKYPRYLAEKLLP